MPKTTVAQLESKLDSLIDAISAGTPQADPAPKAEKATETSTVSLPNAVTIRDASGVPLMVAEHDPKTPQQVRFRDTDKDGAPKVHPAGKTRKSDGLPIGGHPTGYRRMSKAQVVALAATIAADPNALDGLTA